MDAKKKFFLLKQAKNFCAAPWTNIYLHPNGSIRTCCVGQTDLGNIRQQSIEDILDSPELLQIKRDLVADKKIQTVLHVIKMIMIQGHGSEIIITNYHCRTQLITKTYLSFNL